MTTGDPTGPTDYFLSIDGIPGESTDAAHHNWVDVLAYSWGASSTATTSAGGGGGAGKSTVTDLSVSTRLSQASPQLFLALMNGRHIKSAVLEGVRRAGDARSAPFLRFLLEDVLVTSYSTSASEESPSDNVTLAFDRISYSSWLQKADGSLGDEQVVRWDVRASRSL